MKKLLALLLAAVMVLSLAACGGTNTDPTQAPTDGATEPTEAPTETPTDAPTTPVARENKLIFGTNTDVTGDWTNGIVTNGASDMMISSMINDYGTLVTNQEGNYVENKTVLKSWERKDNEDGSATYTISINEGLVYNNGEPITIKDYGTNVPGSFEHSSLNPFYLYSVMRGPFVHIKNKKISGGLRKGMESSIIHIVLEQCRNIDLVYTVYVTPDFREKPVCGILVSHQTQNRPFPYQ